MTTGQHFLHLHMSSCWVLWIFSFISLPWTGWYHNRHRVFLWSWTFSLGVCFSKALLLSWDQLVCFVWWFPSPSSARLQSQHWKVKAEGLGTEDHQWLRSNPEPWARYIRACLPKNKQNPKESITLCACVYACVSVSVCACVCRHSSGRELLGKKGDVRWVRIKGNGVEIQAVHMDLHV